MLSLFYSLLTSSVLHRTGDNLVEVYVDEITGSAPMYKLLINAVLAAFIFPARSFFDRFLKKVYLTKIKPHDKTTGIIYKHRATT